MIRSATLSDVPALTALEERCFESDRLSARSFRHMIRKAKASFLVDEEADGLRGYFLALYHRGTSLARLYSAAVDAPYRGCGVGRGLLAAIEVAAIENGAVSMRLEVRADNASARAFYERHGYRGFAVQRDYYEDHEDAVRMEKLLVPHLAPGESRVPYIRQTLEFTCGPACLLMAMKALDATAEISRARELRIWREATTIFMTSGLGGCGPLGLALAAWRRGLQVTLSISDTAPMFVESVRSAERREVIRLVEADMQRQAKETGIVFRRSEISPAELKSEIASGAVPVVMISSYRLTGVRDPHWVVVAGADERYFYLHDPYVDEEEGRTETDCIGIPVLCAEFQRMTRLGRRKHRATLLLRGKTGERTHP
jgi:ribosomal protein S18 acetylase RimI-like enzyme